MHRIGRTARAGADGIAISLCSHDELPFLRDIEKLIRMAIPATGAIARQASQPRPAQRPQQHGRPGKRQRNGQPRNGDRNGSRNERGGQRNGQKRGHGRNDQHAQPGPPEPASGAAQQCRVRASSQGPRPIASTQPVGSRFCQSFVHAAALNCGCENCT